MSTRCVAQSSKAINICKSWLYIPFVNGELTIFAAARPGPEGLAQGASVGGQLSQRPRQTSKLGTFRCGKRLILPGKNWGKGWNMGI